MSLGAAGALEVTGDVLVVYSDGVTEALNVDGEEFGEDRLIEIVSERLAGDAPSILNAIVQGMGLEAQAWVTVPFWNNFFLMVILIWIQTGFAMVVLSAAISHVIVSGVDESRLEGLPPAELALQLAELKCAAVATRDEVPSLIRHRRVPPGARVLFVVLPASVFTAAPFW